MEPNVSKRLNPKSYANTYLYNKSNNEALLFDFLMKAEEINKLDESFEDIKHDVKKRQVSNSLVKVLDSKKVILLRHTTRLPRAFKVFVAKDIKGDKTNKVFIDCTDIISYVDGRYICNSNNIDILVAYLVSAINQLVYYVDPKRLIMRDEIIKSGSKCFSSLFTHIVDYLYKISNVSSSRDKCIYLSTMYYLVNILGKDINETTKYLCRSNSGLSEREEELILIQIDQEKSFSNIKIFMQEVSDILRLPKLTLDAFLDKWLYVYGAGTQYALELYPAFATMITNVYVGCYLNNQKTIEKITGREMVNFSTAILKVGAESV